MTVCHECGGSENIDQHHVSYEPEKLVPLCRSCHQTVHEDENHPLHPSDSAATTTIQLAQSTKDLLDDAIPYGSYADKVDELVDNYNEQQSDRLTESDVETIVEAKVEQLMRDMR